MGILTSSQVEEFRQKLKDTEKRTEDIARIVLASEPRARNNDIFLMLAVWEVQGINVYIPNHIITMKKLAMPSSISRCRRKIQNTEGMYLPTTLKVAQLRGIKEEVMRDYYGPAYAELNFKTAQNWRAKV